MIKSMLLELEKLKKNSEDNSSDNFLTECLLQGTKSKKYVPLMERQKSGKIITTTVLVINKFCYYFFV